MSPDDHSEENLAELLERLAPPPEAWVRTAQELPLLGPNHAFFYRVTNVQSQTPTQKVVELNSPLKAVPTHVLIMDYVADVFDRGPGVKYPVQNYN